MNPVEMQCERTAVRQPSQATTLVDLLAARCHDAFDTPACIDALVGTRLTWGELLHDAVALADALAAGGLRRGDRLIHVGPHSLAWIRVDLACLLAGVVHVALHADAAPREHAAQARWLGAHGMVFTGGQRPFAVPAGVIEIDARATLAGGQAPDQSGLAARLASFAEACDPDAPATILLSSGTTGAAKGVVHGQRALCANAVASAAVFLDEPRDVRLSWLPMSHALARVGDLYTAVVRSGCLAVVTDRQRVLDACRAVPPAVILGVPAFFERLELGVRSGRITDLAAALGGRVRVCVSGSAPLRRRTADLFATRGVPLVEGYGLAEAGPVVALSNPRIVRPGAVGPPLAGVEARIDTRDDVRGQLLVRTPCRAIEVIDEQGSQPVSEWLETGDLAAIDADGQLRITGRLVDTLVMSTGIKVPPAEVEAALAEDDCVAQVCVIGAGCPWPIALVVPEPAVIRAAIKRMGLWVTSKRAAVAHPRVLAWLARRLARAQADLPRVWRVRRALLVGRPFSADRGEATESLKLKRPALARSFRHVVDACATAGPVPPWLAAVPATSARMREQSSVDATGAWLAAGLWHGTSDAGFAAAAEPAILPLRDAVAAVVEQSEKTIDRLRETKALYEPGPGGDRRRPPVADAPEPPRGLFSPAAEAALGEAGLWGLAVPEAFGGAGASMQELAAAITRIATRAPTAAGMLSLHSSIGAVTALATFGTPEQQARHLPGLAQGRPLSIFGGTEPDAGCDLGAAAARIERADGRLLLTGTKMFITGATYGRLVKVLAKDNGRATVVLVRLPDADTPTFSLAGYPLHPLKHAHNAALVFTRHEIEARDILSPPAGMKPDAMHIVWHGLNRGRVTLAAQAAGTLRILATQAAAYAGERRTWGVPIGSRELVQGRLGRLAAATLACDSLAAWAAAAIDAGQTGELEAICAKVVASQCVREGAIDALGIHGGRAFLVGHPLGDSWHDHFAVTIYEGESDLLGLALFKGLCKHHPLAHTAGRRAAAWLAWRIAGLARPTGIDGRTILDAQLRSHARQARRLLGQVAVRIDRAVRQHGRSLAERQLFVGSLSAEVRDLVSVLAVAHRGDMLGDDQSLLAADCWCRMALARATGRRLAANDHARIAALGRMALE